MQKEVIPPTLEYKPKEEGAGFQIGVGSPQENACLSPNPLGADSDVEVSFVYCNFNKFLKVRTGTICVALHGLQNLSQTLRLEQS